MHQNVLAPDPAGGAQSAPPDPRAGFCGRKREGAGTNKIGGNGRKRPKGRKEQGGDRLRVKERELKRRGGESISRILDIRTLAVMVVVFGFRLERSRAYISVDMRCYCRAAGAAGAAAGGAAGGGVGTTVAIVVVVSVVVVAAVAAGIAVPSVLLLSQGPTTNVTVNVTALPPDTTTAPPPHDLNMTGPPPHHMNMTGPPHNMTGPPPHHNMTSPPPPHHNMTTPMNMTG